MPQNYFLIKTYIVRLIDKILSELPRILLAIMLCTFILFRIIGYKIEFIASASMAPVLKTGQLVLVKAVSPKDCNIGDIVTYQSSNYTITHRIIAETEDSFEFKGDNNDFSDGLIPKSYVLYKVVAY